MYGMLKLKTLKTLLLFVVVHSVSHIFHSVAIFVSLSVTAKYKNEL